LLIKILNKHEGFHPRLEQAIITHTTTENRLGDKESGACPAARQLPDLVIKTRRPDRQTAGDDQAPTSRARAV